MSNGWDWVSAKWWKFDFHNHTPGSDDYGKGPNQVQYKQISPKDWLLNYMRAEIDCVAITDHNSGAWIDQLKQALAELEVENHPEYRPLFLFPGVEITVQGNIHILALFSPEKTTSDIDSILGAVKYRNTKGKSDGCSECSAVAVLEEIHRSGGLAIPAHVDESNGLFIACAGNTLEQILNQKSITAIEVRDLSWAKPPLYTDKKLNLAEVLGTDSHHPTGASGPFYPGSHFTWVKMSEPSFEGLKLALIDGELSLKRSDVFSGNPNTHGELVIESIAIDKAKYIGREKVFDCQFNPWLNTIIGGRGTGKSTILEFLRIILNRKGELPKSLEKEFIKYSQISKNRQDDGLLIDNSILTIFFRKDGSRFRIKWSSSNDHNEIEEETATEVWTLSGGDLAQRFPIRIYSQKQIFELAKDHQALLRIVDDAPEVKFREWKLEWDELVSKYLSIRAQEREVLVGLQEESVIKGQIDDIKRKLEVFEKAEHATVLKSFQLRQNQSKAIDTWEKAWGGNAEQVRILKETLLPPEIDLQHVDPANDEDKELLDAASQVRKIFQNIQDEFCQIVERINSIRKAWLEQKESLKITEKIATTSQDYIFLLEQLSEVGAGDPSRYGPLVKQWQELEEKLKGFSKKREILVHHQNNARDCLTRIRAHRPKITRLRKDFLKKTLMDNSYVQINVIPYGNSTTVEEEFRNLIDRGDGGFHRDIGSVDGDEGLLSLLYQDNGKTMEEKIQDLKDSLFSVYIGGDATVAAAKDRRFITHIKGLDPERVDRLQCWFPDDSLDVQYSLKYGDKLRPIEQGSPGQKTAALLAFILSYGNEPLILDQPEDDLDNHLIYDLIVTQLREIKQQRQIIVVTHNANIVVNGDAENVIVLNVQSGQTRIIAQGCLQKLSIRNKICHVMEGGPEAFERRYRRINVE